MRFQAWPSESGEVAQPVPGDVIELGLRLDDYRTAIREVAARSWTGMVITAAACAGTGSSATVFARLTSVLTSLLGLDPAAASDAELWRAWYSGWHGAAAGPGDPAPG